MTLTTQLQARMTVKHIRAGTRNALKCSAYPAESSDHRSMKFEVCDYLWQAGIDFYTEVRFDDNSRADIVVPLWGVALEVLCSESIDRFIKKAYPLVTIPLSCVTSPIPLLEELRITNGAVGKILRAKQLVELP